MKLKKSLKKDVTVLFLLAAFPAIPALANDNPLMNSSGQVSPIQDLSCDSTSLNIEIKTQGNEADITLNDVLRVYSCDGEISLTGADLNCTTTADDAPKTFALHTGSSGSGTFTFSGNTDSPRIQCQASGAVCGTAERAEHEALLVAKSENSGKSCSLVGAPKVVETPESFLPSTYLVTFDCGGKIISYQSETHLQGTPEALQCNVTVNPAN